MHEMMYNTSGVDTGDSERLRRSTCTLDIVPCKLLKVKKYEGIYEEKRQNNPKSQTEISST